MGLVPKSTKQENKIHNSISFFKIVGLIVTIVICAVIINPLFFDGVWSKLLFTLFSCAVYIVCVLKAPTDPTKLFIQGLKDWLFYAVLPKTIYGESSEEYKEYRRRQEQSEAAKERKQEKKAEKRRKS